MEQEHEDYGDDLSPRGVPLSFFLPLAGVVAIWFCVVLAMVVVAFGLS